MFLKDNCGALRDLLPFLQFKKREKHPWRSVNSACNFAKINTTPGVFFTFSKLCKWFKIAQHTTIFSLLFQSWALSQPTCIPIEAYNQNIYSNSKFNWMLLLSHRNTNKNINYLKDITFFKTQQMDLATMDLAYCSLYLRWCINFTEIWMRKLVLCCFVVNISWLVDWKCRI